MIVAKNDEAKRSKLWRITFLVSTALIILIAVYILTKMFTTNPLEGSWIGEDGRYNLKVKSKGTVVVTIPEIAEETSVEVVLPYSIDKENKTVTIKMDEEELNRLAEKSDGQYTTETLQNALAPIVTSFDYSVEQERLTLVEREYGEQMTFIQE